MAKRRSKRRPKRKESLKFLEELKGKRIQDIEDNKKDMTQADQWKGTVDIYGKTTKVHIEILKPKKSNYYIYIPCDKKSVFGRCVFGPLTKVEKGRQDTEWKKGKGEVPMKHPWYKACVNYSARGSHQGGPMHSYQEHFCMFSKNEKVIDSLITFLSKYSKKVHDKTKKKKGGGTKFTRSRVHTGKSRTKKQAMSRGRLTKKEKVSIPKSKTYTYCQKVKGTTPNKTKVCKQLCHSMSKKGYVFNKGGWLTHCKNRQWYSPDKHTYTAKELKENKERYEKSLPKKGGGKDWDNMYLEYNEGNSHKFWEITRDKTKITTRWGKLDTKGQELTKDYGSKAKEEYLKMIESKKRKGYISHWKKTKSKKLSVKVIHKRIE